MTEYSNNKSMSFSDLARRVAHRSDVKFEGKELSASHISHILSIIMSCAAEDTVFFDSFVDGVSRRSTNSF